jgi:hypothetical protein
MTREVDVAPTQREQLAKTQARIRGHTHELGILGVLGLLDGTPLRILLVPFLGRRFPTFGCLAPC